MRSYSREGITEGLLLILWMVNLFVLCEGEPECNRHIHEGDFQHYIEVFSDPSPEAEIMDWLFFTEYGIPLNRGHIDGFEASRPKILPVYHRNRPYGVVRVTENKIVLIKKDLQKLVLHLRVPFADKALVFKNFLFLSPKTFIDLAEIDVKHEFLYSGPRRPHAEDVGALGGLIQSYLPDFPELMLSIDTRDAMAKECFTGKFYCVVDQTTGELKGSYNQIYYSGHEISIFQWSEFYGGQYIIDHVTGHCFRINRKMRTFRGQEPLTARNDSFPEILTKYPFVIGEDVFLTRRFMLIDEEIDELEEDYPLVTETTTVATTTETTTTTTVEPDTTTLEPWHDHQVDENVEDAKENKDWNYRDYNYDRPVEDKLISTTPETLLSTARLHVFQVRSSTSTYSRSGLIVLLLLLF